MDQDPRYLCNWSSLHWPLVIFPCANVAKPPWVNIIVSCSGASSEPGMVSPVVVWGAKVLVNVNGVVDETAGHSSVVRMIVPLSLQMATKHAPRPSVVL